MSKIEWTDATWNPLRGCSRVSEGCRHCYAERQAIRHAGQGRPYEGLVRSTAAGPRWTGAVRFIEGALDAPLRWRKPRRVFVNSMSDLFHEDVPDEWIDRIFAVMALSPRHTFQVLTKRPERMRAYCDNAADRRGWALSRALVGRELGDAVGAMERIAAWPLPNVWLGVSVEDQATADERIPRLLSTPAAVRFVSAEPLLGPVDLGLAHGVPVYREAATVREYAMPARRLIRERPGRGWVRHDGNMQPWLDWLIVGGESGPGARPCNVDWIRSIVSQCADADVACFTKQLGARPVGVWQRLEDGHNADRLTDRKGGDIDEWPADLRVRQFPAVES